MKKVLSLLSVVILVLTSFIQPLIKVKADSSIPVYNPKLKILEIVDVNIGNSRISNVLGTNSFEVETITMKKFVASREELDGKYDFIAITDGEYSTKDAPQLIKEKGATAAHQTQNILNDITELKANEIVKDFINKGQPVILEKNSIVNKGQLQKYFNKYNGSNKNVIYYDKNNKQGLISQMESFLRNDFKPRPRFELTKKPTDNPNTKYVPGNKLQFEIKMLKPENVQSKDLRAILYIDADFNDRFDSSEIVLEQQIKSSNQSIVYELPSGYSGIRNWKLEVVDMGTNLKDYQKGTIYFKDQMVEVNVLQVQKNKSDPSSLKNENNMKQSYLHVSGEYKINIDVTDMATFNNDTSQYSHSRINGKYDMLIFGFADVYNDAAISPTAVNSVKRFIDTNQSILFTHDTIFNGVKSWVDNFMDATGQKAPHTNLGYGAPNQSKTTQKVNKGMMTKYPYELKDSITIATTHNQYYTLDLEDPDVIPWYNITGSNRDEFDSWNHYYTYSKGNITYSGTGHTNSGFPDEEQKLFVNTMYRAFLGSNHAPVITVLTPSDNDVIPAHQKIELSYKIQDFDLKDKNLSTKVYLNDREVFAQDNVTNGSVVVQSIDHKMPEGGLATLKIVATDPRGAKAEKSLTVKIEKVKTNLEISRSISQTGIVQVDKGVGIEYKINPKDIDGAAANNIKSDEIELTNIKFIETFPANMDVSIPDGFIKSGSIDKGYTVTGNLENILYKRNGNKFTSQPISFGITVVPKEKKDYTLNNSQITYQDINKNNQTSVFNPVTIRANIALDKIELPESTVINKGVNKNFRVDLKIYPENAGIKDIVWTVTNPDSPIKIDPATGVAIAHEQGTGTVKVTVTDVFGNIKEATTYVSVRVPVESIELDNMSIKVGETKKIPIKLTPEDAILGINIQLENTSIASLNKETITITGLKPGVTKIIASGTNAAGELVKKESTLIVEAILVNSIAITPNEIRLNKFEEYDKFKVTILPENATNKDVVWKSLDPNIVEVVEKGKIRGVSTGTGVIEVSSRDGGNVKQKITVIVGSPLTGISTSGELTIPKGSSFENASNYIVYLPRDATNIGPNKSFVSNNTYMLDVTSNGQIFAKRVGEAGITITVDDENGKKYSTVLKVYVVEPGTGSGNENANDKW
ncbi:DUF5057 domain-containing protein [Bacillus sp. FJAT-29790]|uniref:DUF5057 domain-containing protein n=1 Tax=Bacillus sp. FJAT-29790 TaxID=1895002 RepID=UPI001C250829|nr:DUF5057 domain-containing protein [Bacillus sp. FJAT-29790]MBU8879577.1 DUF5057 domain-containing protein [Bacillus sp. FJAT-29790]